MSEARATNPLVEQFRRGGVARDLRLMAAQGLLPLKPEDLVEIAVLGLEMLRREQRSLGPEHKVE